MKNVQPNLIHFFVNPIFHVLLVAVVNEFVVKKIDFVIQPAILKATKIYTTGFYCTFKLAIFLPLKSVICYATTKDPEAPCCWQVWQPLLTTSIPK